MVNQVFLKNKAKIKEDFLQFFFGERRGSGSDFWTGYIFYRMIQGSEIQIKWNGT